MRIAIPVTPDGHVEQGWGRAPLVAVATREDGAITDWAVHQVRRDNAVEAVVVDHMGQGMRHTLGKMGIPVLPALVPDARQAVEQAPAS